MDELTPVYRVEHFLDTIVNGSSNPYDPIYRIEKYLAKIAGEDVEVPTPIYRVEMYLAYLCGMDVSIPEPIYRIEFYLAKKCGMDVETPVPIYRIEYWLDEWASGGSGSLVTVTGVSPLTLANALAHSIHSLTQYGKCTQDGTPTPDAPVGIVCNNGVLRYGALESNLYDPSTAVFEIGYYYNPNAGGAETAAVNNYIYHAYIPIEAGASYVFYGRKQSGNRLSQYNRIHWYDAEKTYISTNTYVGGTIGTGVAPDNAVYARLSCNPQGASTAISEETVLGYNWTFCKGTAEITPFVPFVGGVKPVGTPEVLTVHGASLITSTLSGYGTYVSPSQAAGTRAYKWLADLPNGTYRIGVEGDYEIIIQWRDPADPADGVAQYYENLSGWITSGEVTLDKPSGGYGIAVRRTVGTSSITPANFDGTLYCYKTSDIQTVTGIPMLLSVGNYKDEAELISGLLTHKVGIEVLDGTESVSASGAGWAIAIADKIKSKVAVLCTHYPYSSATMANAPDKSIVAFSSQNIGIKDSSLTSESAVQNMFAAQYAAGTPVIVVYPLAEETTEQTTTHSLHTSAGTNVVEAQTNVDPVTLACEYTATQGGGGDGE